MSSAAETYGDRRTRPAAEDQVAAAAHQVAGEPTLTVIERRPGWRLLDLGELWRYRELLAFLVWRDVKVRYKQTVLGAAWAVLQPLAMMAVFSFFLARVAVSRSSDVPYPLYAFSGLLPWTFFANAITSSSNSLVGSQNMISKVYFPRMLVPMGTIGAGLVDFAIASMILILMMVGYGRAPGVGIVLTPVLVLLTVLTALGVGTLLSALTVAYRDFRYVVPFMVQFWLFATPTVYMQADALGPRSQAILPLNPAFGLIDNFRRATLGMPLDGYSLVVSGAVGIGLLVVGCLYFRRVESSFADII